MDERDHCAVKVCGSQALQGPGSHVRYFSLCLKKSSTPLKNLKQKNDKMVSHGSCLK